MKTHDPEIQSHGKQNRSTWWTKLCNLLNKSGRQGVFSGEREVFVVHEFGRLCVCQLEPAS